MPELRPVRPAPGPPSGPRGLILTQHLAELGVEIDAQLFELALVHRSFAYENGGIPNNERLEFLGDAVLEIVVTDHIYRAYPDFSEGKLAKVRAAVVSAKALAEVARGLDLGAALQLGKGELATGGRDKTSILADATEAIIGAVYLSGGMSAAERFVHHLVDERIAAAAELGALLDPKTELQELCSQGGFDGPVYRISDDGPDHLKTFTAEVLIDGQVRGRGVASSKRHAEQQAATEAVESLRA